MGSRGPTGLPGAAFYFLPIQRPWSSAQAGLLLALLALCRRCQPSPHSSGFSWGQEEGYLQPVPRPEAELLRGFVPGSLLRSSCPFGQSSGLCPSPDTHVALSPALVFPCPG